MLSCIKKAPKSKVKDSSSGTGEDEPTTSIPSPSKIRKHVWGKHVWGKTDPLKFPPHLYTMGVFRSNQPLIEIVQGEDHMPQYNKFDTELKTPYDVRQMAIDACARDIQKFFETFHNPTNELQVIEYHLSLVKNLQRFTIPTASSIQYLKLGQQSLEKFTGRKHTLIEMDEFANEDIAEHGELICDIAERKRSGCENEDFLLHPQSRPIIIVQGEQLAEGIVDLKLYVQSRKRLKVESDDITLAEDMLQPQNGKLVCVFEHIFHESDNATYQGSEYVCKEARNNFLNNHTSPIYVVAATMHQWKYALLEVRGWIKIKEGSIDIHSLSEFRRVEKIMGFKDEMPIEIIQNNFEKATNYYREVYSDCPMATYPDGLYLVGKLYVSMQWNLLPFNDVSGCVVNGCQLFYNGLLRIIIGDRVLSWTKETAQKVQNLRKRIRKEKRSILTCRGSASTST